MSFERDSPTGNLHAFFTAPAHFNCYFGAMLEKGTPPRAFSLAARLRSFDFAARGIRTLLVSQHNARVHALATFVVVVLALALRVSRLECLFLVLAVVAVWTAEAINTALEFLCDVASPEFHPLVEKAKDVAAGAVLICATGAAVVGLLVFGPPLAACLLQLPAD